MILFVHWLEVIRGENKYKQQIISKVQGQSQAFWVKNTIFENVNVLNIWKVS